MAAQPDAAWRLFLSLLPKTHDVSSPRHRPTYRTISAPGDEGVTDVEYWGQIDHVAEGLIEAAGIDPARWLELVGELNSLPPDAFITALNQIERLGVNFDEDRREGIWEALRRKAGEHRFFASAEWALPVESVISIEAVAAKLEPHDPVIRSAWVFSRQHAYFPGTNCDTSSEEREAVRAAAQVAALREIAKEGGLGAIRALIERISEYQAGPAGFLFANENILRADVNVLPAWLEDENPNANAFARGYAHARFAEGGWEWLHEFGVARWEPATFAKLASIFPHREDTWKQIGAIGPQFSDAFWRTAGPWTHDASPAETAPRGSRIYRSSASVCGVGMCPFRCACKGPSSK